MEEKIQAINRLIRNYIPGISEREKKDRTEMLLEEFRSTSTVKFKKAVGDILNDENIQRFPTIAKIRAYIKCQKPDSNEEIQQGCEHCDRGIITVQEYSEELKKYYRFAYRCLCMTGQNYDKLLDIRRDLYETASKGVGGMVHSCHRDRMRGKRYTEIDDVKRMKVNKLSDVI